jgi:hypothetical protein
MGGKVTIMTTKRKKPEAFGNNHRRCLIASIGSYGQVANGVIEIYLKSGETVSLDFEVDYLAQAALKKLDSYFTVDKMPASACKICSNNDVPDDEHNHLTHCDSCRNHNRFKPPAGI